MSVARNRKNILTFLQKNPPYSASCTYKWLSRVTCLNGISQKIRHYIDEETKSEGRARHTKEVPESELPKTHKDYVEHTRHSYVRGFLIDKVQARTGLSPHLMEPVSMLKEVDAIWKNELQKNGRRKGDAAMHSAIIALSPEYCKLLHDSGKDIDEYLLDVTSKTMRHLSDYLKRFYNRVDARGGKKTGDNRQEDFKLGYLVGIHHDRKHIHAHIAIFPYTSSGRFVKIASERRNGKGYDAYNEMRNFARKYSLEKFKRELYAPAYMVEKGEDQVWQRQLLLSKGFNDLSRGSKKAVPNEALIAQGMYAYADDLGNLPPEKFTKKVSEAYEWAEKRYKALKEAKVSPDEVSAEKQGLRNIYDEARELSIEIPKQSHELNHLQKEYDEISKKIADIEEHGSLYPPRRNTINIEEDELTEAMYNSAMSDEEDEESDKEFAKIMSEIFNMLSGKHRNGSMMQLFLGILKGLYDKSDKDEKKKLKRAVKPQYSGNRDKESEDGVSLLLEKLKNRRDALNDEITKKDEINNASLEKLRLLHYKHSAHMLDLYFKDKIVKNAKPLLFTPQIRDIIMSRAGGDGDKRAEVNEVMEQLRQSDKLLQNTPEAVYGKLRKAITLDAVVKAMPEGPIAERADENQKLSDSVEIFR